jgi:dTDP-D-glucose 4,6-dehydratase
MISVLIADKNFLSRIGLELLVGELKGFDLVPSVCGDKQTLISQLQLSKPNLLIPMIIEAIQKNKFMKIYKGVHDFIYVKDFIRGIDKIIQKRNKCNSGEVINLGSGKQLSNFKVLNYVQKIFGNRKKSNFKIINKKYRSYDSDMWVGNIQHALKKYKFRCKYSFIEALRDMKKEYRINK